LLCLCKLELQGTMAQKGNLQWLSRVCGGVGLVKKNSSRRRYTGKTAAKSYIKSVDCSLLAAHVIATAFQQSVRGRLTMAIEPQRHLGGMRWDVEKRTGVYVCMDGV
jgi:hypothetical protein